jgi:hypothetical protein
MAPLLHGAQLALERLALEATFAVFMIIASLVAGEG